MTGTALPTAWATPTPGDQPASRSHTVDPPTRRPRRKQRADGTAGTKDGNCQEAEAEAARLRAAGKKRTYGCITLLKPTGTKPAAPREAAAECRCR
ncbi:hypothetical protein NKH77_17625 [Streptomyces sp. M19]